MSYLGDRVAVFSAAEIASSFVVVAVAAVWLASYCLSRRRIRLPGLNIRHDDPRRPPPEASAAAVVVIELEAAWSPEEKLRGEPGSWSCVVCLGEAGGGGALCLLPNCGHVFHRTCVDSWLRLRPTCPLCRVVPTGVVLGPV